MRSCWHCVKFFLFTISPHLYNQPILQMKRLNFREMWLTNLTPIVGNQVYSWLSWSHKCVLNTMKRVWEIIRTANIYGVLTMAVWGALWKFALYNLHPNPSQHLLSRRGNRAEGKWLAQGHPDGKVLGFSVLVLGNPRPSWLLSCDSHPPGGSEEKPSPFSLWWSWRLSQVSFGPSCPFGARTRQYHAALPRLFG